MATPRVRTLQSFLARVFDYKLEDDMVPFVSALLAAWRRGDGNPYAIQGPDGLFADGRGVIDGDEEIYVVFPGLAGYYTKDEYGRRVVDYNKTRDVFRVDAVVLNQLQALVDAYPKGDQWAMVLRAYHRFLQGARGAPEERAAVEVKRALREWAIEDEAFAGLDGLGSEDYQSWCNRWQTWVDDPVERGEPGAELWDPGASTPTRSDKGCLAPTKLMLIPGKKGEHKLFPGGVYGPGRKSAAEWDAFVASIKAKGVLSPVFVVKEKDGRVFIYEGNHRIRAAHQAGIRKIPVEIRYMAGSQRNGLVYNPKTGQFDADGLAPHDGQIGSMSPHRPSILKGAALVAAGLFILTRRSA